MEKRRFGKSELGIRLLREDDLGKADKFKEFFDSLIEEKAKILENKKRSIDKERKRLKEKLRKIKEKKAVIILGEKDGKIISLAEAKLLPGHKECVVSFSIYVRKDFREKGLGSYLLEKLIELSPKTLLPSPKIVRLSVFKTNKRAIKLYKRFGFKKVAEVPRQYEYDGTFVDEIIMIKKL